MEQQNEIKISYLCARVEEAIEKLRKFEITGFKEYCDMAIMILEELEDEMS
ncbi:MAG: hypothetical protein J7J52_04675 [Deltaproteobacteria bacterium]|nr:hypothetical protein [Deltaproteobacteria bacterium]